MLIWIRLRYISELKDETKNSRTPSVPFEILAATAPSKGANHLSCSRLSLTFQWGAHSNGWQWIGNLRCSFSLHFLFRFFSDSRFCLKHYPGPSKASSLWMILSKGIGEFWELSDEDQLDIALNFSAWSQRDCQDPSKESIRICWVHRLRLSHDRCRAIPVAEQEGFLCDCEVKRCRIPSCL